MCPSLSVGGQLLGDAAWTVFLFALWSLECGGYSGRDAISELEFIYLAFLH